VTRFLLRAIAATLLAALPIAGRFHDRTAATGLGEHARPRRAPSTYETLPLSFEVNDGQTNPLVKFLARGRGFSLFLTADGAKLRSTATRDVLGLTLLGANPATRVEGLEKLPGKSHYFLGHDPAKWRTNVPSFARVKYRDVYPGIDLVFYGNQGSLEYDLLVAPGADVSRIHFKVDGAHATHIDSNGDLIVRLADVELRQLRPVVYQDRDDGRHFLEGRYVLGGTGEVGFEVAGYRSDMALVIDPVLAYSSFWGGSDRDVGHAVAVDQFDNVYITGQTASMNFPTQSPEQPANAGLSDAFVTKLDPTGTTVLFSSYLGGSGNENDFNSGVESSGVAVDSAGNVCLAGRTSSPDFPVVNALFPGFRGLDYDGFVSKLSADGSALLYSTYFGGEANDSANGIAVDSSGSIYVTGGTRSQSDFPVTAGAFQSALAGQLDAFVAKIDPTQAGAASLIYSTFLGGGGIDRGTAIAVDAAGNAYVTGRTESPDFPTQNPLQVMYGGSADAFVAVLNPTGTALVYSTFLGGSALDVGNAIVLDATGSAYISGETKSTDFPTVNGFQTGNGGNSDAFVAQLDPTGTMLLYATYLGGGNLDRATGIALDSAGKISVAGETSSADFPLLGAFQGTPGGGRDVFVARLDPSQQGAASLMYSSFLGGSADDVAFGVAVNSMGDAWVVGQTMSASDFPIVSGVQASYGGGASDAFIARVSAGASTPDYAVSGAPPSLTVAPGGGASYTVTVTPAGGFTGTVDLSVNGLPADAMASFTPPSVVIADTTPQTSTLTVSTATTTPVGMFPLSITASSGTQQHMTAVTLVVATDSADLSLTKTGSPNPVAVGTNLTYTISATNQGPAVATGVQVMDTPPGGAVFVSATPTQGECSGDSSGVTCSIGTLDVGSSATVTMVVTPQTVGSVSNTATVTGDQSDPNPDNNSATAVTMVIVGGGMPVDVLQHHLHATRDGSYVDPLITQNAATTAHRDVSFNGSLAGEQIYAQPLYVNNGPNGTPAFVVATEQNNVVVLDAGNGTPIWRVNLGTPVSRADLPCGDIDPLGITGTPVIDLDLRVIFLDAMTTPDGGTTKQHFIYALSLDDGSVVPGWPIDVNSLAFGGLPFDSTVQNQRGALLLNAGVLYVPYGGHFGDCGTYHGWVVAVSESDPTSVTAWASDGVKAGIWAVGGLTTDGTSIFAATGNTSGSTDWMGGEAILRLGLDDTFSGNTADFFTPSNWFTLDQNDLDLGGEAPLVVDVPGATPSQLVIALGKSGVAHVLDRTNLGGIGTGDGDNGEGLFSVRVATEAGDPPRGRIRTAGATYTTASGTYVVFSVSTPGATGFGCPGTAGDLVALLISASNPPTINVAWCADNHGRGAPIVTTTDGSSEPVVWTIGAEGTNQLFAYNGETGDPLFAGGGPDEQMTLVRRFQTPIAVNGRIIVAGDGQLYVFTVQ
jgi:uncharacterized repeat protein (TIGR01451 family)